MHNHRAIWVLTVLLVFPAGILAASDAEPSYDLLLTGGHVIDPATGTDMIADVAVCGGAIARVAPSISPADARRTVNVSGYHVSPGLIDMHAHVFPAAGKPGQWLFADHFSFQSGVTTMVDAGTAGADTFEAFTALVAEYQTRVLAFLNIAAPGKGPAQDEPRYFDVDAAVETAKKHPDMIVGFKTATYLAQRQPYDTGHTPWASLDSALAAGGRAGLPVMVSFDPRPPEGDWPARSFRDMLARLNSGDIVSCMYAPRYPVIISDGRVNPDMRAARQRGILFESAHGGGSFVFRHAVPAIAQGFLPDTVGCDLHGAGRMGTVVDMMTMLSKMLACGMDLNEVIASVTTRPAHIIGHPELGTLAAGATADIAVFRVHTGTFTYRDTGSARITDNTRLEAVMTISGGDIVWDPFGLSVPEWTEIPKDSRYWSNPTGQEY